MCYSAHNSWPIHQMDVDVAYLNASLEDPIYVHAKASGIFSRKI